LLTPPSSPLALNVKDHGFERRIDDCACTML
jgi:hypothetical protein